MPTLLRRSLTCFYCGKKSPNRQTGVVRRFHCPHCDAVNYLDERGQITDPPASIHTNTVKYAHPVPRSTSPELASPDQTLFCKECVKNQHLLTQTLAEYLPAPSDPEYDKYEASAERYRQELEQRYPQVCATCLPRVRNRIRAAGYAAKTDHLRRNLEKTRQGAAVSYHTWGWRHVLLLLMGQLQVASVLMALTWHVFGAIMRKEEGLSEEESCILQIYNRREVEPQCFYDFRKWAMLGFYSGILSFWWNPQLQKKASGAPGRYRGLRSHMILQILVLVLRWASLKFLGNVPNAMRNAFSIFRGVHAFMVVFIAMTAIISLRLVRLDNTPAFSFSQTIEPSLPSPPSQPLDRTGRTPRPSRSTFDTMAESFSSSFPVEKLGEPNPTNGSLDFLSSPHSYKSAQTVPDDDATTIASSLHDDSASTVSTSLDEDDGAMDWTPTRPIQQFNPRSSRPLPGPLLFSSQQQPPPAMNPQVAPSPFTGTLPPAPKPLAHQILNPFPEPKFKSVPESQKKDFFSKMMVSQGSAEAQSRLQRFGLVAAGEIPGSEAQDSATDGFAAAAGNRKKEEFVLQQGKFQWREEQPVTGLEGMFESVFSVKDGDGTAASLVPAAGVGGGIVPGASPGKGSVDKGIVRDTVMMDIVAGDVSARAGKGNSFLQHAHVLLVGVLPLAVGGLVVLWKGYH